MGESDMKMDEQPQQQVVETADEDKKSDIIAGVEVVVQKPSDADGSAADVEVDEEVLLEETAVNGEVVEDELIEDAPTIEFHDQLDDIEVEAETIESEALVDDDDDEVVEEEEELHQVLDDASAATQEDAAAGSELVARDSKSEGVEPVDDDDDAPKSDEKQDGSEHGDAVEHEVTHGEEEVPKSDVVEEEVHAEGESGVEPDTDVVDADAEEMEVVQEVVDNETDGKHNSILENALKNGSNDSSENLNKMQHMEDVREGCDSAQPSSPGHAEQRSEFASETTSVGDDASLHNMQESYMGNSIKVEMHSDEDNKSPKRKNADDEDIDEPAKKLKKDVQQESYLRNKILAEYTEALDSSSFDQLQGEEDKLVGEIHNLGEHAKEKERQWNNIIHMKKMKEELLLRIQRKKQVYLMSNGDGAASDGETPSCESNGRRSLLKPHQTAAFTQSLAKSMRQSLEMNGHDPKGRNKGPVRNVQSIIDDYRQRHPETVPRRGRRIRNVNGEPARNGGRGVYSTSSYNPNSTGSQGRSTDANSEIALLLSTMENANSEIRNDPETSIYKEFLEQIANCERKKACALKQQASPVPAPFPEVTVHAVTSSSTPNAPTNSLLHGILTKTQVKTESRTTFSPTLARLLTAPDKSHGAQPNKSSNVSISDILSTNKARSEITITPVGNDYEDGHSKRKHHVEEEAEDSADRLVIDEGNNEMGESRGDNNSDGGDEVPQCQGCNQKAAQFVCAGCGNQWYCSRECQVTAWDEHSDVCSG